MKRVARTGTSRTRLRLPEQFQYIRVSPHQYRLVSLYDSLTLNEPEELAGTLDRVIPALHDGATLAELTHDTSPTLARAIRAMVKDFLRRGIIEKEKAANGLRNDGRFRGQGRFLANFQAVADMSPTAKPNGNGSVPLQQTLRDSSVMVVGLGRVGSRVATALAAANVGTIIGADAARVAESDTIDSAFGAAEIGKRRDLALKSRISAANASVAYSAFAGDPFADAPLPSGLSMLVLCEDVFDPAHHGTINRRCVGSGIPWIGYRQFRTRVEIGPTVIPRETACFTCYEQRRASNSTGFAQEMEEQTLLAQTDTGLGGLNITMGSDLLALEIVKSLTKFTSAATYGNVFVLDVVSLATKLRPLLKIPRCPDCGKQETRPAINIWRVDTEGEGHDA